jgi:archaellum component FlaG (FlaF/FlaG flagellin family)
MKKFIITAFVAFSGLLVANAQTTPATDNPNQADITFDKETHDFGIVPQNIPATYTFTFKNTGKEPLIITNAAASCGCTTPEWTKEPILPGKKGFVKATFNAATLGTFNKAVNVSSNAKKANVTLYIKGDVKTPAEIPAKDEKGKDKTLSN